MRYRAIINAPGLEKPFQEFAPSRIYLETSWIPAIVRMLSAEQREAGTVELRQTVEETILYCKCSEVTL